MMPMNMPASRSAVRLAIALAACGLALPLGGCLISSSSSRSVSGAVVEREQLAAIDLGHSTPADVERAIGAPSHTSVDPDGREVWSYKWNEHVSSSGAVLFIFGGSSRRDTERTVHVAFEDGLVSRVWQE